MIATAAELRKGLALVATVGSTAPFVGLFGTVSVALEGAPLASDDLAARLGAIYAGRTDKSILLAAARTLSFARVVEVMDACRLAGIERIGVVTAPPR